MANISVIIPLFNKAEYVRRALDSVFAQSYQDFEILVIDDGSTDGGPELIKQYQDSRLRMVRQKNQGPGSARNRGIKESTAPYVAFLDADDEWLTGFLETYLQALTANQECDYVVGPWFEGSVRTDKSRDWRDLKFNEGVWSLPLDVSHTELHSLLTVLHSTCTMLCTRSVIERYGGFYSKNGCRYGEDRYLQLQLLLNHKLYRLFEPLYWHHTETIGISAVGTGPRPLIPILTDPEPVRQSCPDTFRPVLERYLSSHALGYALEYARAGGFSKPRDLILRFPAMRKNRRKFAQLICLMAFSKLLSLMNLDKPSD